MKALLWGSKGLQRLLFGHRQRIGIGRKLLTAILLASSIVTLLAILVQLLSQYERESSLLQRNLKVYFHSTLPSLSQALWDADLPLVRQQMNGALSTPGVQGLVLTSIEGYVVKRGDTDTPADETWQLPLIHEGRRIGKLELDISRHVVRERMRNSLAVIIFTQAIKTFLMSIFILWVVHRLVTRYLVRASRQLADFQAHPDHPPLNLGRTDDVPDELDMLESAFNALHRRLTASIFETRILNDRLQRQSAILEQSVERKTATLQHQYRAADLLTQLSIDLMQMPDEQREREMPNILARTALMYEVEALAFFRHEAGEYRLTYAWPQNYRIQHALPEDPPDGSICIPPAGNDRGYSFFPIYQRQGFAGLLAVESRAGAEDSAAQSFFFGQLARVLFTIDQRNEYEQQLQGMNERLAAANADLQTQAETDALTGVLNRRPFNRALDRALRRASRKRDPVALLLLDIDFFKRYNDHFGHLQGDRALVNVAQHLRERFQRATDIVARFGGEEFVMLVTDMPLDKLAQLTEDVRQSIWDQHIDHPDSPFKRLTVSIGGYWCRPTPDSDAATLIREADRALYRAKAAGRNQSLVECDSQAIEPSQ